MRVGAGPTPSRAPTTRTVRAGTPVKWPIVLGEERLLCWQCPAVTLVCVAGWRRLGARKVTNRMHLMCLQAEVFGRLSRSLQGER